MIPIRFIFASAFFFPVQWVIIFLGQLLAIVFAIFSPGSYKLFLLAAVNITFVLPLGISIFAAQKYLTSGSEIYSSDDLKVLIALPYLITILNLLISVYY